MSTRRRWLRWVLIGIPVIVIATALYIYFSFAWIFFVKPGPGGKTWNHPITAVAGHPEGQAGFADGVGAQAAMNKPIRLALLDDTTLVFADINNHAIRTLRADGTVRTLAGGPELNGYQDGPAETARFSSPHGVSVRGDGAIAVSEASNHTIRLMTPVRNGSTVRYQISTFAGKGGEGGMRDGPALEARFRSPHAVCWGPAGELYVADIGNARIRCIRDGQVETIAGQDRKGCQDGALDIGTLTYPMDLALDPEGRLWIADAGALTIRTWSREKGLQTPFPGLQLAMPHGIAVIPGRAVVIAELYGHRILSFDLATAQVSTLCGTTEKGIGAGRLNRPAAVLIQGLTLWIADLGNHRIVTIPLPNTRAEKTLSAP